MHRRPAIHPPQPDNFYYEALRLRTAEVHSEHADLVAARRAELASYPCIAMPPIHDLTCSQSVLYLAAQLTKGGGDTHHALLLRIGDLTVPQMRRTLERMTLAHFPIYILVEQNGPLPEDYFPEFLMTRGSKPRDDNWAMLYCPRTHWHQAHWTFTQIAPPVGHVAPEPVQNDALLYTHLPWRPQDNQFWRCKLSENNQQAYLSARALGRACHCDLATFCRHEEAFLDRVPGAKRVSLLDDVLISGSMRGQLEASSSARHGPHNDVVVQCGSEVMRLRWGHHCTAILDVAKSVSPFSLLSTSALHRPAEPSLFSSETEVCIEVPIKSEQLRVSDFNITTFTYQPRYGVFNLIQIVTTFFCGVSLVVMPIKALAMQLVSEHTAPRKLKVVGRYQRLSQDLEKTIVKALKRLKTATSAEKIHIETIYEPDSPALAIVKLGKTWWKKICEYACETIFPKFWRAYTHKNTLPIVGCMSACLGFYFFYISIRAMRLRLGLNRMIPVTPLPQDVPYGYTADLTSKFPAPDEISARLALLPTVTRDHAYDLLRRITAEHKWLVTYDRQEIEAWVERVMTEPGLARMEFDKPGLCLNCKRRPMRYRCLCKICWARLRNTPLLDTLYINDGLAVYIGVRAIFSDNFAFPPTHLKKTAVVYQDKGRYRSVLFDHTTPPEFIEQWYSTRDVRTGYRGRNTGPTFVGQSPKCFPRGHETAVVAFIVRLGGDGGLQCSDEWIDHLVAYFSRERIVPIEPETEAEFLGHFTGDKLRKMLEARENVRLAKYTPPDPKDPKCYMTGFTKAEKSYWFTFLFYLFFAKTTMKPRFICCPSPEFLYTLGPYTHAQTKWLSRQYTWQDNMFYAGCAQPQDLNLWLNFTLQELGSFITIADDITACDSSHSAGSMRFHASARRKLFKFISDYIEMHYRAEEHLVIKVGRYTLQVKNVNGSGVSDTSFKNSLLCLFIRIFAIAHAACDLMQYTREQIFDKVDAIRRRVFTTASGDDGLSRMHRFIEGTDMTSDAAIERYNAMWALFNFRVVVQVYPENRWRMATYLAMRPTWTGSFYEWTPEPARRLRGLFWQIDNSMHPVVWGRSVAVGLRAIASANPILGPLVEWYLNNTQGPTVEVSVFNNPHSAWKDYSLTGTAVTTRAVQEMLLDYELTARDYDVYLGILRDTPSVYVDMNCRLLVQLYRLES